MIDLTYYKEASIIIVGLSSAILAWVKFGTTKPSAISTASSGNASINDILNHLVKDIDGVKIVSIAEVTNGGGIPEIGKPLYLRNVFSTDVDTLRFYQDKHLLDGSFTAAINRVLQTGDASFVKDEFKDNNVKIWFEANEIAKTHFFLIGIDKGVRVLMLIANLTDIELIESGEHYKLLNAAAEIKKLAFKKSLFQKIFK